MYAQNNSLYKSIRANGNDDNDPITITFFSIELLKLLSLEPEKFHLAGLLPVTTTLPTTPHYRLLCAGYSKKPATPLIFVPY